MAEALLPRILDDSLHSVVGKARRISQTSIESFLRHEGARPHLPTSQYGRFEVREVDVKTALTRCAVPGEPWSLNPYTGCSHACAYCYVPDVAHLERARWGRYVLAKRNLPAVLSRELRRRERRDVFLSSATDPYQPVEREFRITRRALELLARARWPLGVLTRNPLVRRDVDLFRRFEEFSVGMSVPTLDDEARRLVEPGAPPIGGRLRTLRALADEGFEPFVNLAPCYPLTGGLTPQDVARAFRDAGVANVNAIAWRYVPTLQPFLAKAVAGTAYEPMAAAIADPATFDRLFRDLAGAFRAEGVPFRASFR